MPPNLYVVQVQNQLTGNMQFGQHYDSNRCPRIKLPKRERLLGRITQFRVPKSFGYTNFIQDVLKSVKSFASKSGFAAPENRSTPFQTLSVQKHQRQVRQNF